MALIALGGVASLALSKALTKDAPVPLPLYGGSVDFGFSAEITIDPDFAIKGVEGLDLHKTSWKWTFSNRTDAPISLRIPHQKFHLLDGITGRKFIDLPEGLTISEAIELGAGEKKHLVHRSEGFNWSAARDSEHGFEVVAEIDSKFYILACAATTKTARLTEQGGADQPAAAVE